VRGTICRFLYGLYPTPASRVTSAVQHASEPDESSAAVVGWKFMEYEKASGAHWHPQGHHLFPTLPSSACRTIEETRTCFTMKNQSLNRLVRFHGQHLGASTESCVCQAASLLSLRSICNDTGWRKTLLSREYQFAAICRSHEMERTRDNIKFGRSANE
jgi:hypothetical protein